MNIVPVERILYECEQDYIYRTLRENIVSLTLEPGEELSETTIANYFERSRSPICGALSRLREEHLIVTEPQRKTVVAPFAYDGLKQAGYLRYLLETEMLVEAVNEGKSDQLCQTLMDALEAMDAIYSKKDTMGADPLFTRKLRRADKRFHYSIYEAVGRTLLLEYTQKSILHYQRLQSLQRRDEIQEGDFISHHMDLIKMVQKKDIAAIQERKASRIERLDDVISSAQSAFPEYFE